MSFIEVVSSSLERISVFIENVFFLTLEAKLQATRRVHRLRIVEWPSDMMVSCDISGM